MGQFNVSQQRSASRIERVKDGLVPLATSTLVPAMENRVKILYEMPSGSREDWAGLGDGRGKGGEVVVAVIGSSSGLVTRKPLVAGADAARAGSRSRLSICTTMRPRGSAWLSSAGAGG